MATTPTTNYGWLIPVPGTEIDTWGPIVNTVFQDIDDEVFLKADIAGQTFTGQIITSPGSAAAPGLGIADTDSGFYQSGADNFAITLGGVKSVDFTPAALIYENFVGEALISVRSNTHSHVRLERADASSAGPTFRGRKSRGTIAVPVSINNGDTIANFKGDAYNGTSVVDMGGMAIESFQAVPGPTANGSRLIFSVNKFSTAGTKYTLTLEDVNGLRLDAAVIVDAARAHQFRAYTVATVPTATPAGRMIQITDEAGGTVPAFSDGTKWRRVTDRQIIST